MTPHEHPKSLIRGRSTNGAGWMSLNGEWDFALDAEAQWHMPDDVEWTPPHSGPFAPEDAASGIYYTGFFKGVLVSPILSRPEVGARPAAVAALFAVDYAACVWIKSDSRRDSRRGLHAVLCRYHGVLERQGAAFGRTRRRRSPI